MRSGTTKILLIAVSTLALFWGGGNKVSGVGKALGKSIRERKEEVKMDDEKPSCEKNEEEA